MDSRDAPGAGGVFFKYIKNRLSGSGGHMREGEVSFHSAVLTAIVVSHSLLELTSELPLNLSALVLPTDTFTYTPQG